MDNHTTCPEITVDKLTIEEASCNTIDEDKDNDGIVINSRTDNCFDDGDQDDQQMLMDDTTEDETVTFEFLQECNIANCWPHKYCAAYIFVLLIIIVVAASVALVVIIILVVRPYFYVSNFATSKCTVTEVSESLAEYTCSCGKGCNSKYTCIHIKVNYMVEDMGYNVTLHENEVTLNKEVRSLFITYSQNSNISLPFSLCLPS